MMNGEETDGGISLGDMEKALVCLLMTSMEAPVQAESAGLTQEMFADASLGFVYEVIMKIYATGVRPDMVLVERGMREADEELAAKLGGLSFLLPYMLNVRHDGNVAAYVEGIKKQYKLRCLVTLFGTMAFKAGKVSSVPEELVDEAERLLMQFRQKTAEGAPVRTIGELAAEAVSWHYRRFGGELEAEQVKSGLAEFDYVTGGFHNTELTIVAGRPSDGKTAVTLQMALNAARAGKSVCFFSLEMSKEQLVNRMLSLESHVDAQKIRTGRLNDEEWMNLVEGSANIANSKLFIDDTPGITLSAMRSKCRKLKMEHDIQIVIIDYLQLMSGNSGNNASRQQEISDISRGLKALARELNVPVIALSQLSRAVEQRPDHRPMLSDLRESGAIEQDADVVMFLYREGYYNRDLSEAEQRVAEVIIAKQRNGPIGTVNLLWIPELTKFTDMDREPV